MGIRGYKIVARRVTISGTNTTLGLSMKGADHFQGVFSFLRLISSLIFVLPFDR